MKQEIYVATKQGYSFLVQKLDRNGKPMFKIHRVTGAEYPVMESVEFSKVATKSDMWNLNYLSMFEVTKDTPEHHAKRVRELAADDSVTDVMTYEQHEEKKNPDAARMSKKLRTAEEELSEAKAEIDRKNTALEEMNRRIAALEGGADPEESGEKKKGGRSKRE